MKNLNYKKVKGYIEGYYGKLLTWNERMEILDVLSKNNMNFSSLYLEGYKDSQKNKHHLDRMLRIKKK